MMPGSLIRRWIVGAFIVLAALVVSRLPAADSQGKLTVTAHSIEESRERFLVPQDSIGSNVQAGWTHVLLSFRGEDIRGVVAYSDLNVTEAVDNLGTSLTPESSGAEINSRFRLMAEQPEMSGNGPAIHTWAHLAVASRRAERISTLRGQLKAYIPGPYTTITFPHLLDVLNTKPANPILAKAQVKLQITRDVLYIRATFTGHLGAVGHAKLCDVDGKTIAEGSLESSLSGTSSVTLPCLQPIDNTMSLTIEIAEKEKTVIFPFLLRDIPLP